MNPRALYPVTGPDFVLTCQLHLHPDVTVRGVNRCVRPKPAHQSMAIPLVTGNSRWGEGVPQDAPVTVYLRAAPSGRIQGVVFCLNFANAKLLSFLASFRSFTSSKKTGGKSVEKDGLQIRFVVCLPIVISASGHHMAPHGGIVTASPL